LLFPSWLFSQSIERAVTSTAGENQSISGIAKVSWTIGEPVINNFLSTNDITSGFQQGEKSVNLPVRLLTFEAKRQNPNIVYLNWKAAWSSGFKGFWIERKLEGENEFQPIIFIEKKETENYTHPDANNHFDNSYYRLKMVELDGSFEYSNIKVVEGTPIKHQITFYPNPVENDLNVRIQVDNRQLPQNINYSIYSINGQLIVEHTIDFQYQFNIPSVEDLTSGWYILKVKLNEYNTTNWKFFKK
jgi:hypothetical protein